MLVFLFFCVYNIDRIKKRSYMIFVLDGAKEKDMRKKGEECVLYDRQCIECGECDMCDLDPQKVCDNCGKCLDIRDDAVIRIDGIIMNEDDQK